MIAESSSPDRSSPYSVCTEFLLLFRHFPVACDTVALDSVLKMTFPMARPNVDCPNVGTELFVLNSHIRRYKEMYKN